MNNWIAAGLLSGQTHHCPKCGWTTYNTYERPSRCLQCESESNPEPAPESAGGEISMSLEIDEKQISLLDNFRSARDEAHRYAQSKVDRATLFQIAAARLIAESRELVSELNEELPVPNEEGADIGPIPGAGGRRR